VLKRIMLDGLGRGIGNLLPFLAGRFRKGGSRGTFERQARARCPRDNLNFYRRALSSIPFVSPNARIRSGVTMIKIRKSMAAWMTMGDSRLSVAI